MGSQEHQNGDQEKCGRTYDRDHVCKGIRLKAPAGKQPIEPIKPGPFSYVPETVIALRALVDAQAAEIAQLKRGLARANAKLEAVTKGVTSGAGVAFVTCVTPPVTPPVTQSKAA
jgi:hypothetical protein